MVIRKSPYQFNNKYLKLKQFTFTAERDLTDKKNLFNQDNASIRRFSTGLGNKQVIKSAFGEPLNASVCKRRETHHVSTAPLVAGLAHYTKRLQYASLMGRIASKILLIINYQSGEAPALLVQGRGDKIDR